MVKRSIRRLRAGMAALQLLPLKFPWAVVQLQGFLHLRAPQPKWVW